MAVPDASSSNRCPESATAQHSWICKACSEIPEPGIDVQGGARLAIGSQPASAAQRLASTAASALQQPQQPPTAQFQAPPGLPKALHPPALPLPYGRFPKSALLEFFQGLLRQHVTLPAETSAADVGVFQCQLRTPPVDAVVSGWHVVIPELHSSAAGYDKKTAQHAAALHALEQLQDKLQVKEMASKDERIVVVEEWVAGRPRDDELDVIERVLGYSFRDRDLLRRAFWHPSVGQVNNARLALVGDAVLDVCALSDVYDAAPEVGALSVEEMNAFRTDRCCRAACARIADAMGLRPYVVTHASYRDLQGGRVAADSMIAETLEAIIGAIFEDAGKGGAGMERAFAFYKRHWPSVAAWALQAKQKVSPAGGSSGGDGLAAPPAATTAVLADAEPVTPAAGWPSSTPHSTRSEASKRVLDGNGEGELTDAAEAAKKVKQQADAG